MPLYKIVGSYFIPHAKEILKTLKLNTELTLIPEPENQHDPNAIGVWIDLNSGWQQLGYLPKETAKTLQPFKPKKCTLSFAADGSYLTNLD